VHVPLPSTQTESRVCASLYLSFSLLRTTWWGVSLCVCAFVSQYTHGHVAECALGAVPQRRRERTAQGGRKPHLLSLHESGRGVRSPCPHGRQGMCVFVCVRAYVYARVCVSMRACVCGCLSPCLSCSPSLATCLSVSHHQAVGAPGCASSSVPQCLGYGILTWGGPVAQRARGV
jgi:hypothetical protein